MFLERRLAREQENRAKIERGGEKVVRQIQNVPLGTTEASSSVILFRSKDWSLK